MHGVEPFAWLQHAFNCMVEDDPDNRVNDSLPWA